VKPSVLLKVQHLVLQELAKNEDPQPTLELS